MKTSIAVVLGILCLSVVSVAGVKESRFPELYYQSINKVSMYVGVATPNQTRAREDVISSSTAALLDRIHEKSEQKLIDYWHIEIVYNVRNDSILIPCRVFESLQLCTLERDKIKTHLSQKGDIKVIEHVGSIVTKYDLTPQPKGYLNSIQDQIKAINPLQ